MNASKITYYLIITITISTSSTFLQSNFSESGAKKAKKKKKKKKILSTKKQERKKKKKKDRVIAGN